MAKDKDDKPKRAKLYVSPDIAESFRALGDDWEAKVEAVLRAHLDKPAKGRMRDFLEDVAGPYLPQIEAVTRDVASRVAKDVATAAAAAAMAAWSTKRDAPAKAKPGPKAKPKPAGPKPAGSKASAPKA